uniref:hypothetical protein n=1 Tax=Salmonella enterica TaxID=28901 RepID=UPI00344BBAE3
GHLTDKLFFTPRSGTDGQYGDCGGLQQGQTVNSALSAPGMRLRTLIPEEIPESRIASLLYSESDSPIL